MQIPESITNNLHFLCIEVDSQIAQLQAFFADPSVVAGRKILDRSGYALNLKLRIHNSCLEHLARHRAGEAEAPALRSVELAATELDRIAELCRDCVRQTNRLDKPDRLHTATMKTIPLRPISCFPPRRLTRRVASVTSSTMLRRGR